MTAPLRTRHRRPRTRAGRARTGRGIALALTLTAALAAGCSGSDQGTGSGGAPGGATDTGTASGPSTSNDGRGDPIPDPDADSGPTTETVTLTDPVEQAFTVAVPKGWSSVAYSTSEYGVHREVVVSTSPDGGTTLFVGDPKTPQFWNPDTANPTLVQFAEALDYMELRRYVPAETYVTDYTATKFGDLPGFELGATTTDQELVDKIFTQYRAAGLPLTGADAARVGFAYDGDGGPRRGLVSGYTLDSGDFWLVELAGISTDRTPAEFLPMLKALAVSKRTNPAYTAKLNAQHEQVMASIQAGTDALIANHQNNMATLQGMAQRHQVRMDAIHATGDASMQSYEQRMDSMDASQRGFLNYVNDERTVINSSGQTFQVDDSYQRYWMKADGTYVGGDIDFGDQDLRAMGLNPGDYEEVKVRR